MDRYQIQVTGEWAGVSGGWRPAIDGTLNQTGWSSDRASSFSSEEEARDVLNNICLPEADGEQEFRIEFMNE